MRGSPGRPQIAVSRPSATGSPAVIRSATRVILSASGLQLPAQLPFEQWVGIGRQLSATATAAAWCLGDWLTFGQHTYAGRYRRAIEQTSLDYQTLRNYAWVASRFTLPRRRDTLSFGHHAEVAALPEAEQDYWLRQAEQHQWPVKRLRHQVRTSLAERSPGEHDQPAEIDPDWILLRLDIRIPRGQLETCQAAASKASLSIEAWTLRALEHAAHHELDTTVTSQPPTPALTRTPTPPHRAP
jgi:hypothetical protein